MDPKDITNTFEKVLKKQSAKEKKNLALEAKELDNQELLEATPGEAENTQENTDDNASSVKIVVGVLLVCTLLYGAYRTQNKTQVENV
ncbi:MAG: hypothetical protein GQ570_12135 [Helicobacteraceae bacterium]|nr:hypothetical protein [Helicobacteraceae bacterium]